jgi:hypothetical protein
MPPDMPTCEIYLRYTALAEAPLSTAQALTAYAAAKVEAAGGASAFVAAGACSALAPRGGAASGTQPRAPRTLEEHTEAIAAYEAMRRVRAAKARAELGCDVYVSKYHPC